MTTFISQGANLRVVLQTGQQSFDSAGKLVVIPEEVAEFAPHGRYSTDDERIIEVLKSRPTFGRLFWELGGEPQAGERPTVDEQLARLIELNSAFDVAGVEELLEGEEHGHNRQVVVRAAQKALESIREAAAEAA